MRRNRSSKRRQKQRRQRVAPAARPAPAAHVAPQHQAPQRAAAPQRSPQKPQLPRVRPRHARCNIRLRKGQPRRNAPRKEPQRQRARPRHARYNIRLRKGQPRRNDRKQLQRVRPHHAPLIHRPGQRRRRPATLVPSAATATSTRAQLRNQQRQERTLRAQETVSCEPFRLRSALRNSRTSISSVSSARNSGYSLTSRRSRTLDSAQCSSAAQHAP